MASYNISDSRTSVTRIYLNASGQVCYHSGGTTERLAGSTGHFSSLHRDSEDKYVAIAKNGDKTVFYITPDGVNVNSDYSRFTKGSKSKSSFSKPSLDGAGTLGKKLAMFALKVAVNSTGTPNTSQGGGVPTKRIPPKPKSARPKAVSADSASSASTSGSKKKLLSEKKSASISKARPKAAATRAQIKAAPAGSKGSAVFKGKPTAKKRSSAIASKKAKAVSSKSSSISSKSTSSKSSSISSKKTSSKKSSSSKKMGGGMLSMKKRR